MAIENETADQVVKMVLQGSEVVLRLSGEASMRVAQMIYAALKGDHTTKGKATLWEFLKSGKPQKVFTVPEEYLKAFTTASKKFGFPFVMLKDKADKKGLVDIMVYATDASKVNRALENLKLTVKQVETIKPEILLDDGALVKPLKMELKVPLELIDGIPNPHMQNRTLFNEIQKYANRIKAKGPGFIEPVGLLCKPDGRYEILPGQGSKRIMALRLAGYKEAVADIAAPNKESVEVKAENIEEKPAQERSEAQKVQEKKEPEKANPTKEEGQTANPTMARTSRDPASGQNSVKRSKNKEDRTVSEDAEKRPSVRKKLEQAKIIAAEKQAAKELSKAAEKVVPKSR